MRNHNEATHKPERLVGKLARELITEEILRATVLSGRTIVDDRQIQFVPLTEFRGELKERRQNE